MGRPWERQVNRFCHQYLQLEQRLDYPDGEHLRLSEVQTAIHGRLFTAERLEERRPVRYQIRVLKELVSRIEASIDDWEEYGVSDDLMASLAAMLATPGPAEADAARQKYHVAYHLSSLPLGDARIKLAENRSLILADGTTGLRTWEAALHLGQYLCQKPGIVAGRRVLELGAGTGYLSILCAKYLGSRHVIASDGSEEVVRNLADSRSLNGLSASGKIRPLELKWGGVLGEGWNGGETVDVVLGADVTYDGGAMAALIGTLGQLLEAHPRAEVLIAATQRNQATWHVFSDGCLESGLEVEDVRFEVARREMQDGPFFDDQVAIRICKVSKHQRKP